jgi:hypothetical protein
MWEAFYCMFLRHLVGSLGINNIIATLDRTIHLAIFNTDPCMDKDTGKDTDKDTDKNTDMDTEMDMDMDLELA